MPTYRAGTSEIVATITTLSDDPDGSAVIESPAAVT
jgi:hypothetical protein